MFFDSRDLVAVPVARFVSGLKTEVDVFIKLGQDNYVLLTNGGESFEIEQLNRYQDHNVSHLYVRKSDYTVFLKQQVSVAGFIIKNEDLEVYKKSEILSTVATSVYEELERVGISKTFFDNAKEISSNVTTLVSCHPDLLKLIVGLNDISSDTIRHSIAVAFTSVLIAKEMNWHRKDTLEKLALGGLIHDIGKKELPVNLLKKSRVDWTLKESQEYETHPYRGMMILQTIQGIPEDVVAIVYEHHENSIGQGFPRKLWDTKIHPLARVVGVANSFCNLIMSSPSNPDPKFADHALYHMQHVMGKPYSKEVFVALCNLVIKKDKKIA